MSHGLSSLTVSWLQTYQLSFTLERYTLAGVLLDALEIWDQLEQVLESSLRKRGGGTAHVFLDRESNRFQPLLPRVGKRCRWLVLGLLHSRGEYK